MKKKIDFTSHILYYSHTLKGHTKDSIFELE